MKKLLAIALMAAVVLAGCKKDDDPVIKIIDEPTAPTVELAEGNIPADTKLTVKATVTEGATLTYQWYSNTSASTTGGNAISGATSASYTLPADLTEGKYYYFCQIAAQGAQTVNTDVITITVGEAPAPVPVISIDTQPIAPTGELVVGSIPEDTKLTVAATVTEGATLKYQWYTYDPAASGNAAFTKIDGATAASYTLPTDLEAGIHWYVCEVSAEGAVSVQTDAVEVTVAGKPAPVISITTQPVAPEDEFTYGRIWGTLTVAATVTEGAELTYQWYENTSATTTGGTAINGATSASYTLPGALTEGEYYYFCEISAEGATSVHTDVVTVTVVPEVDILDKIIDPAFRAYVAEQTDWDTNGSGIISLEEAAEVTYIDVRVSSITSLAGIEYFTGLTELQCYGNKLTELDVSNNTALTELSCYSNKLTSLNVSKNTALTILYCYGNQLEELDVSNNTALIGLSCNGNKLQELDVSNNTALIALYCNTNQLEALDISNNTALTMLYCYYNKLTSLDISNNANLTIMSCDGNPGDGASFPVTAWFDNGSVPPGFTTYPWTYEGTEITVDYQQ